MNTKKTINFKFFCYLLEGIKKSQFLPSFSQKVQICLAKHSLIVTTPKFRNRERAQRRRAKEQRYDSYLFIED